MFPTYENNETVFVNRTARNYKRFDVVAVEKDSPMIKRIIGLPNETVQIIDGYVYINHQMLTETPSLPLIRDAGKSGSPIVLGDDEYFVLGDNRNNSADSRLFGAVSEDEILGKVWPNKTKNTTA